MTIATAMPPLSPSGSSEVSVPRILKPGAVRRIRRPGLFDGFLSGQRARVADKLIPAALHSGSILQKGDADQSLGTRERGTLLKLVIGYTSIYKLLPKFWKRIIFCRIF